MSTEKTPSLKDTETVAKRAVKQVKTAPQKIVEHTLTTALTAIERAATQDNKRKAKRVERTAKKAAKAKQNILVAKTSSRPIHTDERADIVAKKADNKKVKTKNESQPTLKTKIKNKIENLINPQKELIFYYDRRQQVALTLFYAIIALLVYGLTEMLKMYPQCTGGVLMALLLVTKVLIAAAFILTVAVVIFKPTLAVVNRDGIKIDHNELLKWQDVTVAEEKYTSYISRRPLIALHVEPEKLKQYHLTFMQVLCKGNVFTPFSITMYAMRPEAAENIRKVIKKYVKYVDNRN
jgi:hypothetical protein